MRAGWEAAEFGDTWAEVYDEVFAHLTTDGEQAAAFVLSLASSAAESSPAPPPSSAIGALGPDRPLPARSEQETGPRVLELGAGTGRIALPLAAGGAQVTALDASAAILTRLRAKPGGEAVTTVVGDMAAPRVDGTFDVVLIAFNTLFALPDQRAQVGCVAAAADLLGPDGALVIEAAVPRPWLLADGAQSLVDADEDQVAMDVAEHDPVAQTLRSARVVISDTLGVRTLPLKLRYAWPSEIDLMARLSGLSLASRDGGWQNEPFDAESARHVSVYRSLAGEEPTASG